MTTTSDLIANIKERGSFPTSSDYFTPGSFLSMLNDEMMSQVVPVLQKLNEEFFQAIKEIPIVAGQNNYRIPKRAIGSMLRDVQLVDANGSVQRVPRLFEEDRTSLSRSEFGFFLSGNQVLLSPTPLASTGTLRLVYFRRPSKFVQPSACAEITAIDGNLVTVSSLPSLMSSNTLIDFVQRDSPYELLQMDEPILSNSGTTLTFASVPAYLAIGDWITIAGETCVPMIPEELVPMLVQAALCVCLSSRKDKSVEMELQKLQLMKQTILDMMAPRVKNDSIKIKSRGLLNHFRR